MKGLSSEVYSLVDLTTGYAQAKNQKRLVHKMSATLCSGQLTCLIGTNGAGKSTLLRTLAGLQPALSGSIKLQGRPLSLFSKAELAKRVALVLTSERVEPNLTGFELVSMGRIPYTGFFGGLKDEDRLKVLEAMCMVNMEQFKDRVLHSLSDGERQKLMIAKALAQDTDVILLDEPVAFLDFPSKVQVLRLLSRVAKQMQKAVLLSIHDIELALQIADCLWVLQGRDFIEGRPKQLAEEHRLDFLFEGEDISFNPLTMHYSLK